MLSQPDKNLTVLLPASAKPLPFRALRQRDEMSYSEAVV